MIYSDRWLSYFFDVATRTSQLSYAQRLQAGAVAVKDRRIIACGFNGTPIGFPNKCEDDNGETQNCVIHAEENLILFAAKYGISLKDCDLFCTHSPCIHCARMILSCGISNFFFLEDYRSIEGRLLLSNSGIGVHHLKLTEGVVHEN